MRFLPKAWVGHQACMGLTASFGILDSSEQVIQGGFHVTNTMACCLISMYITVAGAREDVVVNDIDIRSSEILMGETINSTLKYDMD